ncbi:MAG: PrsW family intramembrane metalloprotease [Anaerolineales bacterium]|nr:PrsW family intramembrane metalloprotease [Anaerolineales bacterium]
MPKSWYSILQLILSVVASVSLLMLAALLGLAGLFELTLSSSIAGDPTQAFLMAAGVGMAGILVLPSAWYAWKAVSGKPAPASMVKTSLFWLSSLAILPVLSLSLGLGHLVAGNSRIAWLILPVFNLVATILPIAWIILLGTRGLPEETPQRRWGAFASGMVLGPLLVIIFEVIAFILLGLVWIIWLASQPGMEQEISFLVQRLRSAPPTEEVYARILGPYLAKPSVLFSIFFYAALVVPIIEEIFKPIGVWLMVGRRLSPAQGFIAGILGGAGFALFENLSSNSAGGSEWAIVAASRITTALLHILTSGMLGYALASAWQERKYLRLGLAYLLAVTLHSLWNGLALLSFAASDLPASIAIPAPIPQWGSAAYVGLFFLGLNNFLLLNGFNIFQRRRNSQAATPTA